MNWVPLLIAAATSSVLVAVRRGESASAPLQVAAFLLGTSCAFAVDDPAEPTFGSSPTTLLQRRLGRVTPALAAAGVALAVLLLAQGGTRPGDIPLLLAMGAGFAALGLAVAGIAARLRGSGGVLAAPVVFGMLVVSTIVPPRWRPLPTGDIPAGPSAILRRWALASAVGVAVFLWSSRDPARR